MQDVRGKKVYVGLSGGVDSAVTAALLTGAGADVVGVFIKGWYPPGMPCTWAADRRDAMRVAAHLSIPFTTLDASEEYKRSVIDYLLAEYEAGRTPNPDIMCNREVKFGAFYRHAKAHGADLIATGHYARTRIIDGVTELLRGVDPEKDQSYFLWAVPQEALSMTLFPLGERKKAETRALAAKYHLPNATKRDSQGICFLGSISVEEFLRNEFGSLEGEAVDAKGSRVGTHDGAMLHTIGQRIALHGAPPGPWYVVGKDMKRNLLTVAKERVQEAEVTSITLREINLLASAEGTLEAQYRYHGPRVQGVFDAASARFTPSDPLPEPLANGQSLVLYDGDRLIGGGIMA